MKIKNVVLAIAIVFLVWFFVFRSKVILITYDSIETLKNSSSTYKSSMKSVARNEAAATMDMGVANSVADAELYDAEEQETSLVANEERYKVNKYYRVDTNSFDKLIENIEKDIKDLNAIIKVNDQKSQRKVVFDNEFYPKLQIIEFTVDNKEANIEKVEETLKKYGNIRVSNSNKTSIEQELTNYEQQLKEMEEARKALKESKDKDFIARQDADLAKKSEEIKNKIESAKSQSTYKTYTIDVYEVIKLRVNAIKYWHSNNHSLQSAIDDVLPIIVGLFAVLIPITIVSIILMFAITTVLKDSKNKAFREKVNILKEEFGSKNVNFEVKM